MIQGSYQQVTSYPFLRTAFPFLLSTCPLLCVSLLTSVSLTVWFPQHCHLISQKNIGKSSLLHVTKLFPTNMKINQKKLSRLFYGCIKISPCL